MCTYKVVPVAALDKDRAQQVSPHLSFYAERIEFSSEIPPSVIRKFGGIGERVRYLRAAQLAEETNACTKSSLLSALPGTTEVHGFRRAGRPASLLLRRLFSVVPRKNPSSRVSCPRLDGLCLFMHTIRLLIRSIFLAKKPRRYSGFRKNGKTASQVLSEILSGPKDTEWDKAKARPSEASSAPRDARLTEKLRRVYSRP